MTLKLAKILKLRGKALKKTIFWISAYSIIFYLVEKGVRNRRTRGQTFTVFQGFYLNCSSNKQVIWNMGKTKC